MHELSIAEHIVEQAAEVARREGATRVVAVRLRVGALCGVEAGALRFSYDVATEGTILAGTRLEIIDVPLVVWCAHCLREVTLESVQLFRCPTCGTECGEIVAGRDLDIESVEIEE